MFNLVSIIKTAGYLGIAGIVFAESGLLIGFFLPGDSLLFTAGFLASQGYLEIWLLCTLSFISAVAGDSVGYALGKKFGPSVFNKEESVFFHRKNVERARAFYEQHGSKAIVLARFVPIVRTFAPILAGVGLMRYRTFLSYNVIGAAFWAIGVSLLGYYLGSAVPNIDRYLLPIIALIIFISILPGLYHILKDGGARREIVKKVAELFGGRR